MATIQRRQRGGRGAEVRWRVRWRDECDRERSKTFATQKDARRFEHRLEGDLAAGRWIDPAAAQISVRQWVGEWQPCLVDLRASTRARLDSVVRIHVLPEWGDAALSGVSNAEVRAWAARLHASGLSPSSVRKAVFALRRILDAPAVTPAAGADLSCVLATRPPSSGSPPHHSAGPRHALRTRYVESTRARTFYSVSTFVCPPSALSRGGGDALGAQAGEAKLRRLVQDAGFTRFRRATETPALMVLEARP